MFTQISGTSFNSLINTDLLKIVNLKRTQNGGILYFYIQNSVYKIFFDTFENAIAAKTNLYNDFVHNHIKEDYIFEGAQKICVESQEFQSECTVRIIPDEPFPVKIY